ncbi:MAG: hypothetical protein HKN94_10975 [Acidimicrobiales bacterium]|nr:hypothetical protein [Acidimicrobiia bacterium]NNC80661.1 hypothetical protein [Acidimicrobiales bacterium]
MKRITSALTVGLLAIAMVAATASPVSAGNQAERPYKGQEQVFLSLDPSCDFTGPCGFTTDSAGTSSHLGKTTGTSTGIVSLTGPCTLLDGVTPGAAFSTSGEYIITAANGDTLSGIFENSGCAGLAPGTEMIPGGIAGTQTIIGGTGRFEGASGSTVTFGDGIGPLHWVGTLTY